MTGVRKTSDSPVPHTPSATPAAAPKPAAPANAPANTAKPAGGSSDNFAAKGTSAKPPDVKGQLDPALQKSGIPSADRARIESYVQGLPAAGQQRELALLKNVLAGPNADRALTTYSHLAAMAQQSPQAAQRLTPDVREALVRGVSERRTSSDVGQEGILGGKQADEAAQALVSMSQADYKHVTDLLGQAANPGTKAPDRTADPQAERALILKAVAARGDRLRPSAQDAAAQKAGQVPVTESQRALAEVDKFAGDIRGTARQQLVDDTTGLDIDSANTSNLDPLNLSSGGDTRGDNDGIYQRFEDSCGPTTSQLTRSEADPIYALQMHRAGFNNPDPKGPAAQEQRAALEADRFYDKTGNLVPATPEQLAAYKRDGTLPPGATMHNGGSAVSRLGYGARQRLGPQLDAAQTAGALSGDQRTAIQDFINGKTLDPSQQKLLDAGLAVIRQRDGNHPTPAELDAMHADGLKRGAGMILNGALEDIATPATHVHYRANWVGQGGLNDTALTQIDQRLKAGQDVPIRVSDARNSGGHFMLLSDVRGTGDDRRYLLSDPWSGRTAWVSHKDIENPNSGFLKNQFALGWTQVSHFYTE